VISLLRKVGIWINEADRRLEGDATYVIGLAVQALPISMNRPRAWQLISSPATDDTVYWWAQCTGCPSLLRD
jgi:hypothetical protein